jgi:transcriptional regulator with XRE-family HTH domain
MIVRKLRLKRGWSQSQLAEMAGVTTRTIQRIEQGQRPSLETCRALAAVFEVDLSQLQPEETPMNNTGNDTLSNDTELKLDEQHALLYAKRMKEFWEYLITYVAMAALFLVVFHGEPVVYLVLGGVGLGLVVQGLIAFEVVSFLTPGWEKRMAERKLGRKL